MATVEPSTLKQAAFTTLVAVVRDWRIAGRVTTSAGIKPAFVEAMSGKTERDLGFETWREFIEAAVEAGHVRTERLATKHTGILLPGESHGATGADSRPVGRRRFGSPLMQVRLKPDVWVAFIEWQDGYRRLWDSTASRAFVYPVDEHGDPSWAAEPDRFREIEPVTAEAQKEWMREWAETHEPADRAALLAALAPEAPLRSFRQVLEARDLTVDWRDELQRRVGAHVREWAESRSVAWPDLTVRRAVERPPKTSAEKEADRTKTSEPVQDPGRRPARASGGGSDLERLREIVHRAVDRMSYAELAAIPIRAEHLLGDL